jgi:hypothetical protein
MSNKLALALLNSLGIPAHNVARINLIMSPREVNLIQITVEDWDQDHLEFVSTVQEYTLSPPRPSPRPAIPESSPESEKSAD